ncbi:winged helix DNA-binding domain-containing protein [Catenuloplanes indicus]|uniref:Winged helix DNA-binding domain-containing protein n=1 Tax=Catenuloplanes indicus TaxID=137267 RepID=A0AAE3VWJ8_9ACTN|nr:winged helix DNA-binding domain-containing protein [Catenuloplanes indicus]MDQ0364597.1 hypothetical protein [Catenuloplanes indicus]
MRHVTDSERRARLAVRHALAPAARAATVAAATRAVTVLHATEPPTVYLSCWARVDGFKRAELDAALHTERSLVKQLAMRRTLFVFPRDLLPAAWASASARVATAERARLAKDVVADGLAADGGAWVDRARAEVLAALAGTPAGRTAQEIRLAVPMIDVKAAGVGVSSRVLNHLGLTADIVRGTNTGGWHVSRPRWAPMRDWLGGAPEWPDPAAGYREIVRRWLWSFGPGTEDDLVWWLGATKSAVRAALAGVGAVQVSLDGGRTGWLLPDDVAEVADPGPWAALLPVLDPTVMGWQGRDFYLGPHKELIFDTRGNAGTTAWVNGRVVGAWVQDEAGVVRVRTVEPLSTVEDDLLRAEAARLTDWLGGFRVSSVYSSPLMKAQGWVRP